VISAPSVPLSRANFFDEFRALIFHQFVERAHLQGQRVVRGFGLADHFGHQRIDGGIQRLACLVAGRKNVLREPVAGFVDLADEVVAAQLELQQQ
jgi:hypothetical protein